MRPGRARPGRARARPGAGVVSAERGLEARGLNRNGREILNRNGREILYPVEDDRDRWWASKMECVINHHRDLAERDMDGLQAYSLEIVRRVQQKMAKEKCCFCLGRNQFNNM
jgi:hypothetical protein